MWRTQADSLFLVLWNSFFFFTISLDFPSNSFFFIHLFAFFFYLGFLISVNTWIWPRLCLTLSRAHIFFFLFFPFLLITFIFSFKKKFLVDFHSLFIQAFQKQFTMELSLDPALELDISQFYLTTAKDLGLSTDLALSPPPTPSSFSSRRSSLSPGSNTEKHFHCSQCPLSFRRNHDLKRHLKIHLPVRPYSCTHCLKSFNRKDALRRHGMSNACKMIKQGQVWQHYTQDRPPPPQRQQQIQQQQQQQALDSMSNSSIESYLLGHHSFENLPGKAAANYQATTTYGWPFSSWRELKISSMFIQLLLNHHTLIFFFIVSRFWSSKAHLFCYGAFFSEQWNWGISNKTSKSVESSIFIERIKQERWSETTSLRLTLAC